jgi:hypothetical protein
MRDKTQEDNEDFAALKLEVLDALKHEQFVHFFGGLPDLPTIYWNDEIGGGWKGFLEVAKVLQVHVIYLNWVDFTQETVSEALSEFSEDEIADSHDDDVEETKAQLEEFRQFSGRTASFQLGFLLGGLFHVFHREAAWYQEFGEILTGQEDEMEPADEETEPPPELVQDWAEKLASHPKYGSLKGYQHRLYLLKTIAGEMYDGLPTHNILSEAESVYELNYREKDENRLLEEVRNLRAQGLSIVKIAGRMGLSKDRVSMLADRAGELTK